MKAQTTIAIIIIMIAIALVSGMASGTLSFAVRTSSTGTQHYTTTSITPSQFTTKRTADLPVPGQPADCKETAFLWKHTYGHPNTAGLPHPITWTRFNVNTPDCVVAKGTIENDPAVSDEKDGDYHFILTPDTGYKELLNKYNTKGLMVEIICWDKKGIADSYKTEYGDYCNGVNVNFPTLRYGDHIAVTGKWVQDVGHDHATHDPWNEIHPAAKVEKIP
jgi:hypothetical protein